jgi:hypothetical protein
LRLLVVGVLLAVLIALALNMHPASPGVVYVQIPGRCRLMYYGLHSEQPQRTITLDCPGRDSLRLWPLPFVQPWREDRNTAPVQRA